MRKQLFLFLLLWLAPVSAEEVLVTINSGETQIRFNQDLYVQMSFQGRMLADFEPREYVRLEDGSEITEFAGSRASNEPFEDALGAGQRTIVIGRHDDLEKRVEVSTYPALPNFFIVKVHYQNLSDRPLNLSELVTNGYRFSVPQGEEPALWSFQGASYEDRYDWVRPLKPDGGEDNFMGMNASDYGGGIPVVDVWNREFGLAVGVVEDTPKLVSLPVDRSASDGNYGLEVVQKSDEALEPGESYSTARTFVAVHRGDYFTPLSQFRTYMASRGLTRDSYPDSSYEPVWCGWGYEREVTLSQMLGTLPKAAELGFQWAVLDDGWQTNEGDWELQTAKFPQGDADMLAFTEAVRAQGLKPKLWCAPLAADPDSNLTRQHPEYLLLNEQGEAQEITWWDAQYLCPAYAPVQEYHRRLLHKIVTDWGFDGLKLDGQHLNACPPCYNPAHGHSRPEESVEAMAKFLRLLHDSAVAEKPDAVVEVCPCGTVYAFHSLPFLNQAVSSDPENSFQIRHKAKTLKALMGAKAPYYGDHVELSEGGEDFASTFGVGGILGSKFTLAELNPPNSESVLSAGKERKFKLWMDLSKTLDLSRGIYRGELYDIGFDLPEAHVVEKGDKLYFAFYAPAFEGKLSLRGLGNGSYRIRDYVRGKDYGEVEGPQAELEASFQRYLLLEAVPK